MGSWTDGQLIARFLGRDGSSEEAFRVLIHRHGPMVLGVCRRVLSDEHAAEDAFQLTFLIFVKKAGSLRDRSLLTNWLHGVALRVARKARGKDARRQFIEASATANAISPQKDPDEFELRLVIDEEIRRLPERYRLPLVLCHMQGLRHDEVAHRLGCPVGTVESRLSRARQQLRARLTRRGLSPADAVMMAVLRPLDLKPVVPSLAEATLGAAVKVATPQAGNKLSLLAAVSWLRQAPAFMSASHMSAIASVVTVVVGLAVMSVAGHKGEGEAPRLGRADASPPAAGATPDVEKAVIATSRETPPKAPDSSADESDATADRTEADPIRPARFPSAIAQPLLGIKIDGRLDDWPSDLPKYAIRNQLVGHPSYDSTETIEGGDPSAYFMAGYAREAGMLYLAVVVHDADNVVHASDAQATDAVEIYVDGLSSSRKILTPGGDWNDVLNAATMPVLQYAGVPGKVAAYGDRWGANPSLVYARQKESRTKMQASRSGDVMTYEWAVKVFDSYPEKPTELLPGKKLGLDIAVLDKDPKKAWALP